MLPITSRDRRKKALKDLNKHVSPLAEDEEMFTEAAPLLFGVSFEKNMKVHLESLKCLRKSMAPRTGTDQRAVPTTRLTGAAISWKMQAEVQPLRDHKRQKSLPEEGISVPAEEITKRDRDISNSSQYIKLDRCESVCVCVRPSRM